MSERTGAAAAPVSRALLEIRQLNARYESTTVLEALDLQVAAGELVTLLGANGSGKSTALRCLVGLREINGGDVLIDGTALDRKSAGSRRQVAMVFQQPQLVRRRTVLDNVVSGALGRLSFWQSATPLVFPQALRIEAMRCLDRVGLADRAGDKAGRLSGGQQQRVAIARALCQQAPVLLADEPVSALDPASAEQVLTLLADLAHRDGLAVLAVLHQPELARRHCDRIVGLHRGRAVFDAAPRDVTEPMIERLYAGEQVVADPTSSEV